MKSSVKRKGRLARKVIYVSILVVAFLGMDYLLNAQLDLSRSSVYTLLCVLLVVEILTVGVACYTRDFDMAVAMSFCIVLWLVLVERSSVLEGPGIKGFPLITVTNTPVTQIPDH